jgi:hypothetical protein
VLAILGGAVLAAVGLVLNRFQYGVQPSLFEIGLAAGLGAALGLAFLSIRG